MALLSWVSNAVYMAVVFCAIFVKLDVDGVRSRQRKERKLRRRFRS